MTTGTMTATAIAHRAVQAGAAQKVGEFVYLIEAVMQLQPAVILEIGSMNGGSLKAWRMAAPDAEIISVSLKDGPFGGGAPTPDVANVWLDADSHSPATLTMVMQVLDGRNIDFLFIDGDHTYDGVRQDFAMYSWLVRRGGLISLHDILAHEPETGVYVKELWDELEERFDTAKFVVPKSLRDYGVWGGIGMVKW